MKTLLLSTSLACLLALGACNNNNAGDNDQDQIKVTDEEIMERDGEADINAGDTKIDAVDVWGKIDLDAPKVDLPEIKIESPDFETRGTDYFTVYSFDENLLFDTDKATLRPQAEENLEQIAASIKQRYPEGKIRVYGYADDRASKQYNKELSEERAESVKDWLVQHANIDASRISTQGKGEKKPVASNETARGRQLNRRVEIVGLNP